MKIMHYVYVLKSLKDGDFYVGRSEDFKSRFLEHKNGRVPSTKNRRPLKFMYCEASNNVKDAARREKYLKTAWGKRYLKHRLKNDNA
jgi:putative endonuclease